MQQKNSSASVGQDKKNVRPKGLTFDVLFEFRYQYSRLKSPRRNPPPPPPRFPPPLRGPPSVRGRASLTTRFLPMKSAPLSSLIAFFPAVSSFISMNPKPLLRCVNLSITIFAEVTSPYSAKRVLSSSSEAFQGMLAT